MEITLLLLIILAVFTNYSSAGSGPIDPIPCLSNNTDSNVTQCFYGDCNGTCVCWPYYSGPECKTFGEGYWWATDVFRFSWLFGGIATLISLLGGCYCHVQAVTPKPLSVKRF